MTVACGKMFTYARTCHWEGRGAGLTVARRVVRRGPVGTREPGWRGPVHARAVVVRARATPDAFARSGMVASVLPAARLPLGGRRCALDISLGIQQRSRPL